MGKWTQYLNVFIWAKILTSYVLNWGKLKFVFYAELIFEWEKCRVSPYLIIFGILETTAIISNRCWCFQYKSEGSFFLFF